MDKKETKIYEAPFTKRNQVEMEDGICAASRAHEGMNVVDSDSKVNISEQGHEGWAIDSDPTDINATWKE